MSGTQNRWVLRLSTEGADQVVRDLREAATASGGLASAQAAAARAYDALIKAQPTLATGVDRAEQALRRNVDAMRGMRGELNLLGSAAQGATSSLGQFGAALTSPAAAMTVLGASAAASVVQIARLGDQYTEVTNKLRAATGSAQAAGAVYAELVALSQQTGASISESAGAFVRFSVAARAIGATNGEVLQLTRTIQQAGLISGASTQEAASGVQQLGQALASGTLQGDELRSILENMPTLAEALAKELGVSVGQLRTMGSEGQLTSDRVFQALLRAGEGINKQFNDLTPTMGRAFGILGQAMTDFVGRLDQALGLSQAIAREVVRAAEYVRGLAEPATPAGRISSAEERRARIQAELDSLSGEPGIYAAPRRGTISRAMQETAAQRTALQERLAALRENIEAENRIIAEARAEQAQAAQQADDLRQAEEATARARRAEAERTANTASFTSLRDALDREAKLRADHAARLTTIDRALANGDTDAAGAARLRRLANQELADGLKALDDAARRRTETDESLTEVMRAVIDVEKDRQALEREGEEVTRSVRTEAEKYADELARLTNLLNAGKISQETFTRAVAAADPAVKAAAEAAKRIEQENTRTTDRIVDFFGDSFARAFDRTGDGFAGLMESFRRAAISTFATIGAQAIIRPVVAPVVQSLGLGQITSGTGGGGLSSLFGGSPAQAGTTTSGGGGTNSLGSFGTLRQAYNGLTSPGGLGSFFPGGNAVNTGFGFLDRGLNASLVSPTIGQVSASGAFPSAAGFQAIVDGTSTAGLFPSATGFQSLVDGTSVLGAASSPGLTVAGALGPLASIAGGAYGIYSGLQRGGVGGYTSAAGGLAGILGGGAALAGLGALGPIGLGIGAVLSIAGALLPGAKPSGRGQLARVDLGRGDLSFDGLGGERFSQGNRDAATSAVESINTLARELGDALGGARLSGTASVGVTNSTLYLDIEGAKGQFANNEEGGKQLAERASEIILQRFKDQFVREGRTDETAAVLFNSNSREELGQNLEFYERVYKSFDTTADAADKAAEAVRQVEERFAPLITQAERLSLSTGNIIAAREKEAAAARKAVEEAEAARLRELASLRTNLQAREAAIAGADDYAARMAVAATQRTQAWAEELRGLESRLTELGETTEETASATERLRALQGAEYWRNFTTSMEALDRGVIGRILRANGQTGAADVYDFEAGATQQIEELRGVLANLGATAEQAAAKVAGLEQAQQAERDARIRAANEQIASLDQSLTSRILRATGQAGAADLADFEFAAARELANVTKSLTDLGVSAEEAGYRLLRTEHAIGVERIAIQKRIAEESAAVAEAQMRQVRAAGQSVRAFLDAQRANAGPGGVSTAEAFRTAQNQFGTDLALARGGDQEALARITTTADRLLELGQKQFASSVDFQAVRGFVLSSLESLPATQSYDSLILEELRKLGGSVNVEVGIAVTRTITEALNVLPSADLAQLVQAETVVRQVEQVLTRNLSTPERNSLIASAIALRNVEQQLGRNLTAAERASLVEPGSALRLVEQTIGRNLTTPERNGLIQSATVQRNVEQALGRALTAAERALLVEPGLVSRAIAQTVGAPTGAAVLAAGAVTRNVIQAVETTETVQISRSIDDKLSGILNAQLVIGREEVVLLGRIATDMNLLWRYALGEGGGVTVKAANRPGASIVAFARGGVFDSPINFPMAGGRVGLMAEAGPEAIMPLDRGPDGRLGVRASGAGNAEMARAIERLSRQVAALEAQMQRLIRAGERTADATEDTAASNARMMQRDGIVARRRSAA